MLVLVLVLVVLVGVDGGVDGESEKKKGITRIN